MDIEIIRQRLAEITISGKSVAGSKTDENKVVNWLQSMQHDGTWSDITYHSDNLKDWEALPHLTRLLHISKMWDCPDSKLYRHDDLLQTILRGLDAWYRIDPQNPNWWWMQIGAPQRLADILLTIVDHCDSSYIERAIPAFEKHLPGNRFTGQNLVWVAMIEVSHGVIVKKPAIIAAGLHLIHNEVRIMARNEGLQPDMTFFQHGLLLYSGGYGQNFASDVARLFWVINGTRFQWPDLQPKMQLFTRYILDGSRWMVRGRTFDYSAIGREISRCNHSAELLLRGAAILAEVNHDKHDELAALAASSPANPVTVIGNRMFWCADYMAHHRPGFSVTIRVPSNRVVNVDDPCCGGEGRLCHHMAEGATFIYRDGDEYRNIFPVWNWRHIPGTTVEQHSEPLNPASLRGFGTTSFCGGVSNNLVGAITTDFKRDSLQARKSWFCFDGAVVALGAAISSTAAVAVRTTIDQCHPRGTLLYHGEPLTEEVTQLMPNKELTHNQLAVTLLNGTNGAVTLKNATGSWADCGVESTEPITLPVLDIAIDHGIKPQNNSYAYTIQPASDTTAAWRRQLMIVRNDSLCQAVWHHGENYGMAIFFSAGETSLPNGLHITPSHPCALLYRQEGESTQLWLADPTQTLTTITITLRGLKNATLTTTLPVHEYVGSTVALILST